MSTPCTTSEGAILNHSNQCQSCLCACVSALRSARGREQPQNFMCAGDAPTPLWRAAVIETVLSARMRYARDRTWSYRPEVGKKWFRKLKWRKQNVLGDLWEKMMKTLLTTHARIPAWKLQTWSREDMFARTTPPTAHKNTLHVPVCCAGQVTDKNEPRVYEAPQASHDHDKCRHRNCFQARSLACIFKKINETSLEISGQLMQSNRGRSWTTVIYMLSVTDFDWKKEPFLRSEFTPALNFGHTG